jgi:hypothetical protein
LIELVNALVVFAYPLLLSPIGLFALE